MHIYAIYMHMYVYIASSQVLELRNPQLDW